MLVGYWLGVIVNLVNFRLIVIGTKNALEQQEKGAKSIDENEFITFD